MGLSMKQEETKYMEATERPTTQSHIIIDTHRTEVIKEFKYLGTTITFNNNISKEMKARVIMVNKCYYGLK
jgi:competence transcription factor ComK